MNHNDRYQRQKKNYLPWNETPDDLNEEQAEWQAFLIDRFDLDLGEGVYVSPEAVVWLPDGRIGDRTWVASDAVVRSDVELGADCSVNPYATIAGDVTIGDGVRIASLASIWGFNHGFESTDSPIHTQKDTSEGVEIGDDVWIGANSVILDGVTVGSHSIVGAGAVVIENIPEYSIVAGNPATVIRDRREETGPAPDSETDEESDVPARPETAGDRGIAERLDEFGDRVETQLIAVLERYCQPDHGGHFLDKPGADRTVRAWCDAIEIAGMFDVLPPGWERDALVSKLQGLQDPETGLIPDPERSPDPETDPVLLPSSWDPYHILSVGYALEVLDATFEHRISAVDNLSPENLYSHLDGLPWEDSAWSCGSWIDSYATGLYFNQRYFAGERSPASIFGWLEVNVDPDTGMWGESTTEQSLLQPVNGFYRLTRGTYAQFGVDVPAPEAAIDTVLRHSRDPEHFQESSLNACNVLDVVHPLLLCGQQTDYRRNEAQEWARGRIQQVLEHWHDERGFAFDLVRGEPSLQGTEMWLSILYLLADICGLRDELGYEPKGVHRTEVPLDVYQR